MGRNDWLKNRGSGADVAKVETDIGQFFETDEGHSVEHEHYEELHSKWRTTSTHIYLSISSFKVRQTWYHSISKQAIPSSFLQPTYILQLQTHPQMLHHPTKYKRNPDAYHPMLQSPDYCVPQSSDLACQPFLACFLEPREFGEQHFHQGGRRSCTP